MNLSKPTQTVTQPDKASKILMFIVAGVALATSFFLVVFLIHFKFG